MFNIPMKNIKDFKKMFEAHVLGTSQCNLMYYHIKLIAKRAKVLSREDYLEHFNLFSDIDLVTMPMDTFVEIPRDDIDEDDDAELTEDDFKILEINRLCPEFVKIQNRISEEQIRLNLPPDHSVIKHLDDPEKNNEAVIDVFTCDCFYHYCVQQYLKKIDKLRIALISNVTPLIEWVVDNLTLDDIEKYLSVTKNINTEKIEEYSDDVFFKPDYDYLQKFYMIPHKDVLQFDVKDLFDRLISNIVVKSDIYIIIAVYMLLSYCKVPLEADDMTDEKCVSYVRDVISTL